MDIDMENVKIAVKLASKDNKNPKMRAMIVLDFGYFKIKGFRMMDSDFTNRKGEKLWLIPPSYKAGGGFHPIFFMEDKALWERLEDKIYGLFNQELIKQSIEESL